MIYILSCEKAQNGGGIYAYHLTLDGDLKRSGYFPCDRPMYATKSKNGLCVLLREPFKNDENSGYFYVDERLEKATEIQSTKGKVACYLCVDGDDVYIVNYLSGNIVKNGEIIAQRTGKSIHPMRQTEPHTHFVEQTPDGYFSVCDLGTDTLAFYDKRLALVSEEKAEKGYGIRHSVFSKDGKYVYAVNELVPSVSVFGYDDGRARLIDTVRIQCKNGNANAAGIRISENGRYLYVSLREENVICVYAVQNEKLTLLQTVDCGGDSPRDFNIFGEYLLCCNERSSDVKIFKIKQGLLNQTLKEIKIARPLNVLSF